MDDILAAKEMRTAIKQGDLKKIRALLSTDKKRLSLMTPFGTWLHVAASFGKLEIVKYLISCGMNINAYGGTAGGSALHRAASDGHIDVVEYLIACGATLDVSEPERNPLFGAIHNGHTEIAKLLIESGIDTRVKYTGESMKDMDALAFANEWGRKDIAELLIKIR
ncbi:MAG: ankyrin repeat domain-containing protein [Planctomycetota bacterium]|nr:ankyrin repeat domain-containing protein [Planctomycetota bacterium]